jgi:hypothetical protein
LGDVEADIQAVCQRFDSVLAKINGRVPARVIDRWLRAERALHAFAVNGVDAMRASRA